MGKDQIEKLHLFLKNHGVKYYDLRCELVDHFALLLENNSIDEKTALREFGGRESLSKIILQRKKALRKQFILLYSSYFKSFFTFPKICFIIVFYCIVYLASSQFKLTGGLLNFISQLTYLILVAFTTFKKGVFEKSSLYGEELLILKVQKSIRYIIVIPLFLIVFLGMDFSASVSPILFSSAITACMLLLWAYRPIRVQLKDHIRSHYPELAA